MTIEEAMIDLEKQREAKSRYGRLYEANVIRLGIEALKAVKDARANSYWTPIPLLPGETKE